MSGRLEIGRSFYDYAANNVTGRTMADAFNAGDDGIHFVFMKILPQGAERIVNYDYFNFNIGLFFGNAPIVPYLPRSGWGKVVNGRNDEALIALTSMGGIHLYQDSNEAGYAFS
ncbi:MAG: hypothetical protein GWN61_18680, partial [candidate division Zixibacteria bacterium]|nr:hypothetical protein [candidate division KSB1 bacterium]NIR66288.1 hypothetical protein [candidate division Zixibacteria bacterium]NIS47877.1 hypothetical protein [candidate division Zixibacteria bacterium]NIT73542.1 hypothetical protein [candidate division KSB1 bacterium]NIU15995.1 hypothetical protein [candidate division Zixibacteria bacterium]